MAKLSNREKYLDSLGGSEATQYGRPQTNSIDTTHEWRPNESVSEVAEPTPQPVSKTSSPAEQYRQAPVGDIYEDARSKALKEGNYRAYFNAAMQAHNSSEYAKKYLNAELAAQGLQGSGYGSSTMAGIGNNEANQVAQYRQAYIDANAKADEDALERRSSSINDLATEITTAGSMGRSDLNQYLVNAGYMDAEGNYTDKWYQLDDSDRQTISNAMLNAEAAASRVSKSDSQADLSGLASYIESAESIDQIVGYLQDYGYSPRVADGKIVGWNGTTPPPSILAAIRGTGYNTEGATGQYAEYQNSRQSADFDHIGSMTNVGLNSDKTIDQEYGLEIAAVKGAILSGQLPDNSMIDLKHGANGSHVYLFWDGHNFYRVSESQYSSYQGHHAAAYQKGGKTNLEQERNR